MAHDFARQNDRHNGQVPIQLPYPADAPEGVSRALRALSAPTRVSTLRYLLSHDGATPGEIITATSATAVHPALLELEQLGFVTGDLPAGERRGKTVRYSLNRVEFRACIEALHEWILPDL